MSSGRVHVNSRTHPGRIGVAMYNLSVAKCARNDFIATVCIR